MKNVATLESTDSQTFHQAVRAASEPVLMRGFVADWPMVQAAGLSDEALVAAILSNAADVPLVYALGEAEINGCFHYTEDAKQLNFVRQQTTLRSFLELLLTDAKSPSGQAFAAQGVAVHNCLPGFAVAHPNPLLPPSVMPRMWICNAAKVATHNDELENIACVAAGRRRFTLFPPEAVADLYMGPFELTPGGTPISMVHVSAPDFERYPRYAQALDVAQEAELEPGDALYIPYQWYHHVEAFDPINILVNYWWDPARQDLGSPWDALLHGVIAFRGLPAEQRRAWKAAFDHYVFLQNGDPGAHLPPDIKGILDRDSADDIAQLKRDLLANLDPNAQTKVGPFG
ncbi:cupin-like domain-containing protein [Sphingorhabdus sp.]|jgi:hypothetical protein|uniref:cupin-like domain-containing protein n=1 Tax=Sphingorhabdus sp. TaxID=1902408 RepID=UPI003BB09483|nr:cupin-like domain-containing protein [Sphingomonadales bacterium]MBK9432223.1 cupin-like domain-containing protein [Sphingomonadales bacterium]